MLQYHLLSRMIIKAKEEAKEFGKVKWLSRLQT